MKNRLFLSALTVLTLVGCASKAPSVKVDAAFQIPAEESTNALQDELLEQSLRVIDRRLQAMGDFLADYTAKDTEEGVRLTLEAETQEALDELLVQLERPFNLTIMAESAEDQTPDITVDGHGGFNETGINGADIEWVNSRRQEDSSYGEVRLVFSAEGLEKMQTLFQENVGRNIGIFVNRQLVSKLLVDTDEVKDEIVIRDIPDPELAQVFADDVNVGTHVTFTPVP